MHTPALVMFNQVDAYCSVDRRSYTGTYTVMNGLPRNPVERTGIIGQCVPQLLRRVLRRRTT